MEYIPLKTNTSHLKINAWKRTCSFWNGPFLGDMLISGGNYLHLGKSLNEIFLLSPVKTPRRKLHCSSPTRTSKHQGDLLHVPAMEYIGVLSIPVFLSCKNWPFLVKPRNKTFFFQKKQWWFGWLDTKMIPFLFFFKQTIKIIHLPSLTHYKDTSVLYT